MICCLGCHFSSAVFGFFLSQRLLSSSFRCLTRVFKFYKSENKRMSSKKKQSQEDSINEPKVVALPGQSYSYGQTPAALCRQHFKEIAERLNMTVEELAKGILDKSLSDQLCMLRDFYKSKNQETDVIYQPLLELSSVEVHNSRISDKNLKKKRKTEKTPKSFMQKKKKQPVLLLSSDSESEEKMNRVDRLPLKKAIQAEKQPFIKQPLIRNKALSRIESSIEATIAFESMPGPEKEKIGENLLNTSNREPKIAELQVNTGEAIPFNGSLVNKMVTKETAKKPPVEIEHDITPVRGKTTSPQEDLEIFLYGKSPARSKPPPRKKYHRLPPSQSFSEATTVVDGLGGSPSSQFCPPGLTFESKSSSPSSRQRDLLSIARDIAALQKVVASGKKLSDSVSDTIKFTNSLE